MENLKDFLLRNLAEEDRYTVEGLEIDNINYTIRLTDQHEEGINTDIQYNPVYWKSGKLDIISIFRRTGLYDPVMGSVDGNLFVYALKGKYGWKFDMSDSDIIKYLRRFVKICKKIKSKYDTIIMVPSTSDLNKRFMTHLSKIIDAKDSIEDMFFKVSIDEAAQSVNSVQIKTDCKKKYGTDWTDAYNEIITDINNSFIRMRRTGNPTFQAKMVDKRYLKYIDVIVSLNETNIEKYIDKINNKNILILDDNISTGATVSKSIEALLDVFDPKNVTVVTLLSKKMK